MPTTRALRTFLLAFQTLTGLLPPCEWLDTGLLSWKGKWVEKLSGEFWINTLCWYILAWNIIPICLCWMLEQVAEDFTLCLCWWVQQLLIDQRANAFTKVRVSEKSQSGFVYLLDVITLLSFKKLIINFKTVDLIWYDAVRVAFKNSASWWF